MRSYYVMMTSYINDVTVIYINEQHQKRNNKYLNVTGDCLSTIITKI